MKQYTSLAIVTFAVVAMAMALAGCGGSDLGFDTTPTPTATAAAATPTRTPQQVSVAGQIVVDGQVRGDEGDGLNPLPPESMPPVSDGFDRGLGNADWTVDDGTAHGTTDADGHFTITGLAPGRHTVRVTKTVDGNLMELQLVIVVGDDGSADVIAEVTWGLVRTTSTYTENGAAMRAVFAATGAHVITRAGAVVELGDGYRTLRDADGNGQFEPEGCDGQLYACDAQGGCGPDRFCGCIPSCPSCEDCPTQACLPIGVVSPTCGPDGQCKGWLYACSAGDECEASGGTCACIASCPECDDCPASACVPRCAPTEIVSLDVVGPDRLVLGQEGAARASAALSDGSAMDVTGIVTWVSSQPSVAAISGWGHVTTAAVGETDITAGLGDLTSAPLALTVVERPTLRRIVLQNASCYYPYPYADGTVRPVPPTMDGDILPPPSCEQVLRIGATLQIAAVGEFDTGYYEDLTDEVEWRVDPAEVGDVAVGLFTARAVGTAKVSAALNGIESDAIDVRVVDHATVVELSIYPMDRGYLLPPGPIAEGEPVPCMGCGNFLMTLLRDDTVRFGATARYDTGEWEDVTASVTWHSSDPSVAAFDASGVLTAAGAGETSVDASLGDVASASATVRVVNEATLQSLYVYQDGPERVIAKGEQAVFHAAGYYDIGFDRDVTTEAAWRSSDETVGGFDSPGVFTGRAAGTVTVWAELDGQQSQPLTIEVFATSELDYCDPNAVNRATWSDDFNRVTLESDCAEYTAPDVVALRFSVTEMQRPGGIFDPCLDLYAYRGDTLVRAIREEGCGDPFLAPNAPGRDEAALKYQLSAFWDLKDADGQTVPPGDYTIFGRFYLYYDPVVQLPIRVN